MPHLWIKQPEWCVVSLGSDPLHITGDACEQVRTLHRDGIDTRSPILCSVPESSNEHVLLCRPGSCRVNGEPVTLGIHALRDRDEIQPAPGVRCYYSAESRASIVQFSGSEQPTFCPRCLQLIDIGSPTVLCPRCRVAHHQDEKRGLNCWTYAPCALCQQPSALDADFQWTPETL